MLHCINLARPPRVNPCHMNVDILASLIGIYGSCMFQVTDIETAAAYTPIVAMWNMNDTAQMLFFCVCITDSSISLLRRSFRSCTMQIMMDINASLFNPFMAPGFLTLAYDLETVCTVSFGFNS